MNRFGQNFAVEIFGESHGAALGCIIDGVRPGIALSEDDFKEALERRRSGAFGTTPRREPDIPHIVSGVYEGETTGAPLMIIFHNENADSSSYENAIPRPGHADFTAMCKFLCPDLRGGGHFSGRLTLPVVAAGVVARKMIGEGLEISAALKNIGGCEDSAKWDSLLKEASEEGDSLGGIVECTAKGLPVGLGEPFWDSLESLISHAIFSIPGVRGIEFGDGFGASAMKGSEHNDPFGPEGLPLKNGSGGVNGGLSNGAPLLFRVAFKPTSSISKVQNTYDFENEKMAELSVKGRHDVCFAIRTPVIVESCTAIVLADLLLRTI